MSYTLFLLLMLIPAEILHDKFLGTEQEHAKAWSEVEVVPGWVHFFDRARAYVFFYQIVTTHCKVSDDIWYYLSKLYVDLSPTTTMSEKFW